MRLIVLDLNMELIMSIDSNSALGDWAASYAGASTVFVKNGLDFCCRGSKSLKSACEEKGIDSEKLMLEIKELSEGKPELTWSNMALDQMIDEILDRFHKKHREDLQALIPLAKKVESVHADRDESPQGLGAFLEKLSSELESHMQKEEQILFPMIKNGQGAMAHGPINVMMHEHVDHGENLARLRKLAKNFELPEDACGSWVALYQGVSTLEREIMEHIATENNLLFPKALNGL